ncbi:MAG TPA: iron-sulfur cluster repair di-iron protein [Vicinamibacteria bacterium]|nr:iron-sulfur cluster repair di-iron protein [Vicinamibacteria bacterium]
MSIEYDSQVGRIAAEHPLATRVFHRYGIDYCCGGTIPLSSACASRGLVTEEVIEEIQREQSPTSVETTWADAPLEDLVAHILTAYHLPLWEEMPRLEAMARKVLEVHQDKEPELLRELLAVYLALESELAVHMQKEERILFPMILRGQGFLADGPIFVMREEHDQAGRALKRLRELTNDYEVPPRACNTWRALWHGLAALEESLHEHIHLENNILFPRALGSGSPEAPLPLVRGG